MEKNKLKNKEKAPKNRTLVVTQEEMDLYSSRILFAEELSNRNSFLSQDEFLNKTICGDLFKILNKLPEGFADLLVIDPPYNLSKNFGEIKFSRKSNGAYEEYLEKWFPSVVKLLKPTGSVYICGDWKSTSALFNIMDQYTILRNRIIWQREKGRGAKMNWKNSCEDIWFGTMSENYYFDLDSVKQKRRVLAPYRKDGQPKDWQKTEEGEFRLTCPGNFWDDISVPFWSMAENTDHPTQKPEKLIAKLILASCPVDGIVVDPFLGSGTTSVVAKKLGRRYLGIEYNKEYCVWAEKRLDLAENNKEIQGYSKGVFWERNTLIEQKKNKVT